MRMKVDVTFFTKFLMLCLCFFFSNEVLGQSFPNGTQILECCDCDSGGCTLVADSDPIPFNSADNQVYLLVDVNNTAVDGDADNDLIVGFTATGVFNGVPMGDYVIYYVSYNPSDATQITPLFNTGMPIGDLLALGTFQGNGTWVSSDPSFVVITSDLATVNAPDCGCGDPEITIADPCSCDNPNNYLNNDVVFLFETVTITGPPGLTWNLDVGLSQGVYDANGALETQALAMTETSPGVYQVNFFWSSSEGFYSAFNNAEGLPSQAIGQEAFFCDCANGPCFGFEAIAQIICNPAQTEYNVLLIFDGGDTGSGGYTIVDNQTGTAYNNLPTNSINFGPFPTQTGYSYTVSIANHPDCAKTLSSTIVDCIVTAIELLAFDGSVLKEGNELAWTTASENNTDYFVLEYSMNGTDFKEVGSIDAAQNSSVTREYVYLHNTTEAGIYYYRLKEIDMEGKEQVVSEVITLERTNRDFAITNVYPIPTSQWVNVEFLVNKPSDVVIDIVDIAGKVLMSQKHQAVIGSNQVQIDAQNLSSGTYFISISDGTQTIIDKFVKN